MSQQIIGIVGRAGCGKTTLRNYIAQKHGFHILPFAKPLKTMLHVLGLTSKQTDGTLDDKNLPCDLLQGKSPRWAMQSLGSDWGRNLIGEDLWVDLWQKGIGRHTKIIVDDIRFPNEIARIHKLGGITIRIRRLKSEQNTEMHESERHFLSLPVTHELQNNASLQDLFLEFEKLNLIKE